VLRFTLCINLLLLITVQSWSQKFVGTREGLSNRHVTCIQQGKDGIIWIGTKNGLNVYDGYSFKTYFTYSDDFPLSNSTINNLLVKADGTVWAGTLAGLNVFPTHHTKPVVLLRDKNIVSSCLSERNTVFVSTSEGDIYEIGDSYQTVKLFAGDAPCTLLQTATHNKLWFCNASPKKMYALDLNTRELAQPVKEEIRGYYKWFSDTIMVYVVKQGLTLFNTKTGERISNPFLDSLSRIYENAGIVFRDSRGYFWVNYGFGTLIRFDIHKQQLENYSHYFMSAGFGSRITCITEDHSGMIWVGTEGGFVKISQPPPNFKRYLMNTGVGGSDENISVRGIVSDRNGDMYFATYKGLYRVKKNGRTESFVLDKRVFGTTQPLPHEVICLHDGRLLLTSYTKGLLFFDPKSGKFKPAVDEVADSSSQQLLGLYQAPDGNIWVGSNNGIWWYNEQSRNITRQQFFDESHKTIGSSIGCFAQDHKGNTWVGSNSGLYKIPAGSGMARRYHTFSNPALSHNVILSLYAKNDTSLWIASKGGGLMYLNPATDSLIVYNTSEGLSDNIVYGILPDNKGFLWLSTENGLSCFDPEKKTFQNYYERDGINDNEFNSASFYKKEDGELFFGGVNGVISFYPERLNNAVHHPKIVLTELIASDNQIVYSEDMYPEIFLPYDNRSLSLRFALTDFYEPQHNTFYYRIAGLDENWTKLGAQNFVRLNNLPAGEYELQVKGYNMNGIESSNTIHVQIRAGQVFYKATWFMILCVLLLAGVIYLVVRFRIRQVLQLQKLRIKIASDLHDELGSMLTRISILTELLKYQKLNNPEIDQIASVSRMATTTMSDVLWSIDARNDKIGNLIDRMRDHADTLLVPLHKSVDFLSEGIDPSTPMEMQVRQNLLLIFKEAVNNIAKHSNATVVTISFSYSGHSILLRIHDNGTDIHLHENGQGLKNMRMRAEEMGALLSMDIIDGFGIFLQMNL
jgi:ligand-binding sensor domain-containing protein